MTCESRFAQASDFALFWCVGKVKRGRHTGAFDIATLTDTLQFFVQRGVKVGDFVRNDTDGSTGPVVSLTDTTVTASPLTGGTENLWDTGDYYSIVFQPYDEIVTVEYFLDIAAADVQIALAAGGQCDCSMSSAGLAYVKKMNIIDAALVHNCPCGSASAGWSDQMKRAWLDWLSRQMDRLADGTLVVCEGQTGKNYPSAEYVEVGSTEASTLEIYWKSLRRGGF